MKFDEWLKSEKLTDYYEFDQHEVHSAWNHQQEIIDDLKTVIKILEGQGEWTPELSEVLSKVLKEKE